MKRILAIWLLLLTALCAGPSFGQLTLTGAGKKPSGTSYTGAGDITSFTAWVGLRGYSAAYSTGSNPAADVCDASTGLTCSTVNILANGNFDVATASGSSACAVACRISKIYDQTGNGNHFIQATNANRPTLTFNCIGSLPCMTYAAAQVLSNSTIGTVAQVYSISAVANRTSISNAADCILCTSGANDDMVFHGSGFVAIIWGSAFVDAAATENTWHALQGVANGASSTITVDGSPTTGSPGAGSAANEYAIGANSSSASSNQLAGTIGEIGFKSGDFASGLATLNSNQRAYWGF